VGSIPDLFKPRTIKFIFGASPQSKEHSGERADWLAQNQDNVSEWSDMSIHGLITKTFPIRHS
jgi:hypothetical protein